MSKSSARWLREHRDDPYVKRAQAEGYRSRAAYKLLEMDEREPLLRPGATVVDLGAAPGGWSQAAAARRARVYALDLLPMAPIAGVSFLQGDLRAEQTLTELLALLAGRSADVVLSDMAPNLSGLRAVDAPRSIGLAELAFDFAGRVLRRDGRLLLKAFQGEGFDDLLRALRADFASVAVRKPRASRPQSAEIYLSARGFRGVAAFQ